MTQIFGFKLNLVAMNPCHSNWLDLLFDLHTIQIRRVDRFVRLPVDSSFEIVLGISLNTHEPN